MRYQGTIYLKRRALACSFPNLILAWQAKFRIMTREERFSSLLTFPLHYLSSTSDHAVKGKFIKGATNPIQDPGR